MKKIFVLFLIALSILSPISFADDFIEEIENIDYLQTTTDISKEPIINSKNVLVLDRKTSRILYEKSAYNKVPMASTTKIMTCILALETTNLDETVTISSKASSINGSTVGLKENSNAKMESLLYGLMLRSGNDCAIAIAEHISGNIENFSILMNEKAQKLGLHNTHFISPHGLDDDNHFTTAYELALLTNYALNNNTFKKIVSTKTYTININNTSQTITNTNELLGNVEGVYGVKTGFTFNAGRCLISCCKRNSLDIIIVVLGSNTKKERTLDSKNLINYIFNNYQYFDTSSLIINNFYNYQEIFKKNISLEKTTELPILELAQLNNYKFPLTKEEILKLNTKIFTIEKFSSRNSKNTKIGYLNLYANEELLYSLDITLKNDLKANTWQFYFKYIIKNYFKSILF